MLIFLDIDGVIKTDFEINQSFNQNCVKRFNNFVNLLIKNKYNPDIIISSDWQYYYDIDQLKKVFKNNNCVIPKDVTGTSKTNSKSLLLDRAFNILNYCKLNKISDDQFEKSIIIDDLEMDIVFTNAFITNPNKGFPSIETKLYENLKL